MESKTQVIPVKNMGKWKHLNIIQKMSEQYYRKERHQGTTENSHTSYCIHAVLRKVQGGSNMTGTDLCVNKPHCAAAVRP